MPWQPDGELERAVQLILERSRERNAIWSQSENSTIAAASAAKGVYPNLHAFRDVKERELTTFGADVNADVLELFKRVYGDVPVDAVPWIRQRIGAMIDGLVETFTTEIEDRLKQHGVPTTGAGEGVARIGVWTKRDLDIELAVIQLRGAARIRVVAEIVGDFLGLAREALKRGTPNSENVAAVLVAAAFEDTIRKMGSQFAGVQGKPDLAIVLQQLKSAGVIIGPQFTNADSFTTFRNHALHARWSEIERSTTVSCLALVEELLTQHFG